MSLLQRTIDLQKLLLNFYHLERTMLLPDVEGGISRNETDTEHSYSLAMAAWYIAQEFPHLDTNKCIRYALVHDLHEIYAGDTFIYDPSEEVLATKAAREEAAIERMAREWPDFSEMNEYLEGYERREDPESRFVYALDKIMPMILNHLSGGRNYRAHGITLEDVKQAKADKVAVSPEIQQLYKELIAIFEARPDYFEKKKK